ncbi:MAG: HAD-IB family phosphatase [Candidatus Marinimicrobia bacterium]|nr:HAD-IB family phosphatase [Candidatus Neomarinimicrobiota bacterium]MBL7009630.1 HAD-IB family phosphatase [Candidatus Neomarinimicrobiota bacterium]MBL7029627.1 HAD-IB family phosphatase [Candidatus Neomarinimicrobiota bacterium]
MFPDSLIIDFDSTFISGESLDELSRFALKNHPDGIKHLDKIHELTREGMEGKIPFNESLSKRMRLLDGSQKDVTDVTHILSEKITPSFNRNKQFIRDHAENILIISGGFREMIIPIVAEYGIDSDQVFANEFIYDSDGNIIKVDTQNLMAAEKGKAAQANVLNLSGDIHVIGDGFTDYQIKSEGPGTVFFAFIENVGRENVCKVADYVLGSFDDYITIVAD